MTETEAVERLLRASRVQAEWFAPTFAVPISAVDGILRTMKGVLGSLQAVTVGGGRFHATFERGVLDGTFELSNGRFARLDLDRPHGRDRDAGAD